MSSLLIIILMINISTWIEGQNLEKSRSVWVEQGLVRGRIYKIDDRFVQIFRGIPYAEPPVGDLRFRRPVKRGRWHQELTALEYGAPCIQFMDFHRHDKFSADNMAMESEDCLYLNVFSPYDPEDEAKSYPVLVWIHGGSFLAGSGDTGIEMEVAARNLVFKGVTLVTLNYRLGALGFVTWTREDGMREGNFGIWDQVMALEWVQANIKQFNGDPDRVTAMGESAGAAAVSVLALSPIAKGVVHQVIALSGSSTAGWAIHRHSQAPWDIQNILQYLRCEKKFAPDDVAEILQHTPPMNTLPSTSMNTLPSTSESESLCNLQESMPSCAQKGGNVSNDQLLACFRSELNFTSFNFRKGLAVELGVSKMVIDGRLITASGQQLVLEHARIPLLIGVARREWAHKRPQFYNFRRFDNLTRNESLEAVRKVIDVAFHGTAEHWMPNSTLELITNATYLRYIDNADARSEMPYVVRRLQDLEADIEFVAPCQREVDGYARKGVTVFVYSFDYFPRQSVIVEQETKIYELFGHDHPIKVTKREKNNVMNGSSEAYHGLDHAFIFSRGYSSNLQIDPFTEMDQNVSDMLTTLLTNFVKFGNPTPSNWSGFEWPSFTSTLNRYALLDLPPRIAHGPIHWPATNFWNEEVTLMTRYASRGGDRGRDKGKGGDGEDDDDGEELSGDERMQLNAYRRAWWALWLLVGLLALVIWTAVICLIIRKCHSPSAKPYNNIIVGR